MFQNTFTCCAKERISPRYLLLQVFYWVCNTEEDFDRAFSMGQVAIVTDYPSDLVSYLSKHPEIPRGTFSKAIGSREAH